MINIFVEHIVWGRGKILSRCDRYVKVLFEDSTVGTKIFVYPDAFAKYIKFADKESQLQIECEMQRSKKAAEEQAVRDETERQRAEAVVRDNAEKTLSMKIRAIAYSRKRAEKLRVKRKV